jgi:Xaa-Pro aminopeptidase
MPPPGPLLDYAARLEQLQARLRRKKIDVLLVGQPENRRYLSGYCALDHGISESAGVLFVPARGEPLLLTDFRFGEQAERETALKVVLYNKGLLALLHDLLSQYKIRRLGFESHYTLHSSSLKLAEMAEKHQVELTPQTGLVEKLRLIKSDEEIGLLRSSVALNEAVFNHVFSSLDEALSEIEIASLIEARMREVGAERPSFNTIVAAAENAALPHAVPTARRVGKAPMTIDMGLIYQGYCSDMTRSISLGKVDEKYLKIHRLVRQAQQAGLEAVRPGALMKEVDQAARSVITAAGYGPQFGHSLGHGVGLAVHEKPSVSSRSRQKLRPGMIITIEPGIYLPGWGGVRLENMVVVTEDGCEELNRDTTWLDI